jgi:hypothetical protein
MALNPYFSFQSQNGSNSNERDLIRGLHQECIQIHGYLFIYVPRDFVKLDLIFGEDVSSAFTKSYEIEAWVENFEGYGPGGPDIITKFGMQVRDELYIRISGKTWTEIIGADYLEPREGDLVYSPINRDLLEIKWVEDEDQFYPLGQQMTWKLRLESFNYAGEKVRTGRAEIDAVESSKLVTGIIDSIPRTLGDNVQLEAEKPDIVDFSESSPFGDY